MTCKQKPPDDDALGGGTRHSAAPSWTEKSSPGTNQPTNQTLNIPGASRGTRD